MAVAPAVVSSIFLLASIALLAVFGSLLVQYATSLVRARELLRREIEASRGVLVIEGVHTEGGCLIINLTNRGSSSVIVDERATVLLDYYTPAGHRLVEPLEAGTSWFVGRSPSEADTSNAVVELRPGGSAIVRACPSHQFDTSRPIVVVVVSRLGVRAEYVYSYG